MCGLGVLCSFSFLHIVFCHSPFLLSLSQVTCWLVFSVTYPGNEHFQVKIYHANYTIKQQEANSEMTWHQLLNWVRETWLELGKRRGVGRGGLIDKWGETFWQSGVLFLWDLLSKFMFYCWVFDLVFCQKAWVYFIVVCTSLSKYSALAVSAERGIWCIHSIQWTFSRAQVTDSALSTWTQKFGCRRS